MDRPISRLKCLPASVTPLNNLTAIDLAPQHAFVLVDTKKVPVVTNATNATFSPNQDAVIISRTAVQMKVTGL